MFENIVFGFIVSTVVLGCFCFIGLIQFAGLLFNLNILESFGKFFKI
jgi:hypothetical protein